MRSKFENFDFLRDRQYWTFDVRRSIFSLFRPGGVSYERRLWPETWSAGGTPETHTRRRFQPALVRYDGKLLFNVGDSNNVLSSRFIQIFRSGPGVSGFRFQDLASQLPDTRNLIWNSAWTEQWKDWTSNIERPTSNIEYWWRYALSILKQANHAEDVI